MTRIVKRFLLHYQKDSENSMAHEFEELKQDLQMIRFEMSNDLKKNREEALNTTFLLHSGISLLGQELFKHSPSPENHGVFKQFKTIGDEIRDTMIDDSGFLQNVNRNNANPTPSTNLFVNVKSLTSIATYMDFVQNQKGERQQSEGLKDLAKSMMSVAPVVNAVSPVVNAVSVAPQEPDEQEKPLALIQIYNESLKTSSEAE